MKLRAVKALKYQTRRLLPGDEFEAASNRDARLLLAIKKAEKVREPADVPPPSPVVAAKIAASVAPATLATPPASAASVGAMSTAAIPAATQQAPADRDLAAARADYEKALGRKPYHGWDIAMLRSRIATAKTA